jgi:hypothetical protein
LVFQAAEEARVLVLGVGRLGVEHVPRAAGELNGLARLEWNLGHDHGLPFGIPQLDFVERNLGTSADWLFHVVTEIPAGWIRIARS